jgi:hypothetical protein
MAMGGPVRRSPSGGVHGAVRALDAHVGQTRSSRLVRRTGGAPLMPLFVAGEFARSRRCKT